MELLKHLEDAKKAAKEEKRKERETKKKQEEAQEREKKKRQEQARKEKDEINSQKLMKEKIYAENLVEINRIIALTKQYPAGNPYFIIEVA